MILGRAAYASFSKARKNKHLLTSRASSEIILFVLDVCVQEGKTCSGVRDGDPANELIA